MKSIWSACAHVEVIWTLYNQCYPEIVEAVNEDGRHIFKYTYRDLEMLNMDKETWLLSYTNNN